MKAKEMMDKEFVFVSKNESIKDVSIKMEEYRRFTAPVLDENMKLEGWITSFNITHHTQNGNHGDNGHDPGFQNHGEEHNCQRHHRGNCLGNGLGDHLPQGVNVTGVTGHKVACSVGVKIPQGKPLHFPEHFVPDMLLDALGDADHQVGLEEACQSAYGENTADGHNELCQGCKICGAGCHHGQDEFIHQIAQSGGAGDGGIGGGEDTQHHHNQGGGIGLQVTEQPQEGLLGILGFAAVTAHFCRRH